MNTQKLCDSNLKEEMMKMSDFITNMLGDANNDKLDATVLIHPQTYTKHLSILYLVIEMCRAEVFLEAKQTGNFEGFNRLNAFLKDMGI